MASLLEFLGRLHPALVHLPIGILLLFSLLVWVRNRFGISHRTLALILGIGAVTSVLSVATGLLLGDDGEYDVDALGYHKWLGIVTTLLTIICWLACLNEIRREAALRFSSTLLFVVVIVTGHAGNDLVRGSTYLTEPFTDTNSNMVPIKGNIQEALFYQDVIQPILKTKCYNCHGEQKQKGKLRLDDPEYILKGGKSGKAITPGSASDSELITRINLPQDDDDHMPPKERKQLSNEEIAWITAWVGHGADFSRPVKEILDANVLAALQQTADEQETFNNIDVSEPDQQLIDALINKGVAISRIAEHSQLLQINMVSAQGSVDSVLNVVGTLGENVISLKLGGTSFSDAGANTLTRFPNVRQLTFQDTKITDASLGVVAQLKHLQYLNLNGTSVTASGLEKLRTLTELQSLFIYHTSVSAAEAGRLQTILPRTKIEKGGYDVPTLETDTIVLTPR